MMEVRNLTDTTESHAVLLEEFMVQYELSVDKAVFYPGVF